MKYGCIHLGLFFFLKQVNILGTDRVIEACARNHVRALVYTSTYNVVFGGQNVFNGDESLPYFPLSDHVDHYSRTKAIAEKMVFFSLFICSAHPVTIQYFRRCWRVFKAGFFLN